MFSCSICGRWITGKSDSLANSTHWSDDVHVIYIEGLDYLHPKTPLTATLDFKNNPILLTVENPSDDEAEQLSLELAVVQPVLLPDGSLNAQSRTTGYAFHKHCYQLLEWACQLPSINIKTLNLMLRSFGIVPATQVVDWGHTYGNIYRTFDATTQPIYPNQKEIWGSNLNIMEDDIIRRSLTGDALSSPLGDGHDKEPPLSNVTYRDSVQPDVFSNLPIEILEYILMELPSRDVRSIRMASRSFANIPLRRAFWRSRFSPGQEFDYVVEARLANNGSIYEPSLSNPKVVYKVVKSKATSSTVLRNRKQVWGSIQPLAAALHSFSKHEAETGGIEPCGVPLASLWQPELEDEDMQRWLCAFGELKDSELQPFHFGSKPIFKRHLKLQHSVEAIRVSVLPWHNTSYITGLRFCFADGSQGAIGYILADREVYLPTGGLLRGLKAAISERGIHGISLVDRWGAESRRVGSFENLNVKTLGKGTRVTAVKAYFDGLKMVFVGVPDYIPNPMGDYRVWKKAKDWIEISNLPVV